MVEGRERPMNFLWEQELVDFRQEVRGFIQENWEDDNGQGEGGSLWATPRHREFIKKMARRAGSASLGRRSTAAPASRRSTSGS